ncbi:hypothetical protein E3N88_16468 [Mikania micrantha]|uniref:EF-hand domain-containing protein n=1 Tax=Mikania micrantha TaxID=192012 RepID=A0A5N6NZR1_9ASTR|nr:hypothetical protein E3N88_16468 [Mikania micrantha]
MEELRFIARASYRASSSHVQRLARGFFASMDHDGDGKIDQREFLAFMKEAGHSKMCNRFFFNQLDVNKDGTLDFSEVMMVYYIIQSGRPFCDCCDHFITSTYFTCVTCLEHPNARPYYLCLRCYDGRRFNHHHGTSTRFVDSYSLLEYLTKLKLCELRSRPNASSAVQQNSNSGYNRRPSVQYPHTVYNYTSIQNYYFRSHNSSPHHVQHLQTINVMINPQHRHWKMALDLLNAGVYAGAMSSSFCSIL